MRARLLSSFFVRLVVEVFEDGERFFGDVPLAEDFVDGSGGESGGDEAAHDASGFFFVIGLADALLLEVFAGESFFIGAGVAVGEGLFDEWGGDALGLQILADATLAEVTRTGTPTSSASAVPLPTSGAQGGTVNAKNGIPCVD